MNTDLGRILTQFACTRAIERYVIDQEGFVSRAFPERRADALASRAESPWHLPLSPSGRSPRKSALTYSTLRYQPPPTGPGYERQTRNGPARRAQYRTSYWLRNLSTDWRS